MTAFMKTVLIKKRYLVPSEPHIDFNTSKGLKIQSKRYRLKKRAKLKINHWLRWFGHVLSMPSDKIPKVSLRWTPTGRRERQVKDHWRRTVMKELKTMGLSISGAKLKPMHWAGFNGRV